ncbi:hypothetical protein EZV62_008646 [Acer yangbiense]|uniref:Uncharacterized protein n=1 Tax=Acer yangbiense TaxID=1000413 RepID=A0A5C7IE10_9ROSI|nr:hypothetical protein EZV62_008646 [Acer yangbiense]
MKDLGAAKQILGMRISRVEQEGTLKLSQAEYLLSSSQCTCAALFADGSAVVVACRCTGDWRNALMLLF